MTKSDASRSNTGPALLVCSLFAIATGTIALKKAYEHGSGAVALSVSQQIAAGVLALLLLPRAVRSGVSPRQWAYGAASGATLAVSNVCGFEAFSRLPAAITLIFIYSSPVWVGLGQTVFLRTPPTRRQTIAVCLAIAGIAVMVGVSSSNLDLTGVVLGLASGMLFAATLLWPGAGVDGLADYAHLPWAVVVGVLFWLWITLLLAGQRETSPMAAIVVLAAEPAVVAVLGYLYLSEGLGARDLAGGALLLAAALLAISEPVRARPA